VTVVETAWRLPHVGRARVAVRPGPAASPGRPPRQTVLIPTRNERDNIAVLLSRLAHVLPAGDTEIVFVDDSTDDTPQVIESAARDCPIPVTVHHRTGGAGGLGGAVVEGLRIARGAWVVVLDADLQHPPELVPDLIAAGVRDGADLVVASRYAGGGGRRGLADRYRRLVSRSATWLTKLLFRGALVRVSDPMSGFFAVRASSVDVDGLRPIGYKILLDLVVRTRPPRTVEIPYVFQPRHAGQSKSSVAEGMRFLRHLAVLRLGPTHLRMLGYAAIGASGLLPNLLSLWLLSGVLGVYHLAATVLANQVAIAWNFALTDLLLFRHRRHHRRFGGRLSRFLVMGNADLVVRLPAVALLVGVAEVNYLKANVLALAVSVVLRFLAIDRLIYRRRAVRSVPGLEAA
jgi:dolichol-phosphate mannosyltransferase